MAIHTIHTQNNDKHKAQKLSPLIRVARAGREGGKHRVAGASRISYRYAYSASASFASSVFGWLRDWRVRKPRRCPQSRQTS